VVKVIRFIYGDKGMARKKITIAGAGNKNRIQGESF